MGQYHDLYLVSDTLQLCDVFERFRKTTLEYYKLDPCHYLTCPSLSWDSGLKIAQAKFQYIKDYDMLLFINRALKGGYSLVAQSYARMNNKNFKDFNPSQPETSILNLDANNLYGYAMSQPLPIGDFSWVKNISFLTEDFIRNHIEYSGTHGYFIEATIIYPEALHGKYFNFLFYSTFLFMLIVKTFQISTINFLCVPIMQKFA